MSDSTFKAMSAPQYLVPMYTDLRTPFLSSTSGGSNPPTASRFARNLAGTSQGVFANLFPSDNTEREVYMTLQLPHEYAEGTILQPHIHYSFVYNGTTFTGNTKWGLEYTYAPLGGTFANVTTTIDATSVALNSLTDTYKHLVLSFPDISLPGATISSMFVCRIFRYAANNGDTFGSGIFALEFDMHYQSDTAGSRTTTTK